MKGRIGWGAVGLVLGLAVALTLPSLAQPSPSPGEAVEARTITVMGTATIRSTPDEAVVTLGVNTQASTAQQAMEQNADKMAEVARALLGQGLREEDLATSAINLYPNYSGDGQSIASYTAENQVNVTVHDLRAIGRIIDGAVASGANLASGITFQLSGENEGLDQALQVAAANALSKAQVLAGAADAELGQVMQISESSFSPGPVVFEERAGAGGDTPVSPPTLETQVSVTVTWALA